ncbi:hypothetical protein SDC9_162636 [bioreactor metagenome]|uniref:Uncharacterized protein n=1 Tax=bioreactor metagenome TaxID=1076179 RepID=A0A645FNN2_9ZZZZ
METTKNYMETLAWDLSRPNLTLKAPYGAIKPLSIFQDEEPIMIFWHNHS